MYNAYVCIFVYNYAVMQVILVLNSGPQHQLSIQVYIIPLYKYSYTQCITSAYLCIIMQLCKLYLNSGPQHQLSIQVYIIQLYKYSYTQCITSAYFMQSCKLYLNSGPRAQHKVQSCSLFYEALQIYILCWLFHHYATNMQYSYAYSGV